MVDLAQLTSDTINSLVGTDAISNIATAFQDTTKQLDEAAAARKSSNAVNIQAATDMVTLEQERQRAKMTSAETQAKELGSMASALDRAKEIDNSFWLQVVEPLATTFNLHEYSRELLTKDIQRSQQALQIDDARNELQTSIIDGKARELNARVTASDAVYKKEAGDVVDLQAARENVNGAIADIQHAQTTALATLSPEELQAKVTKGELKPEQMKSELDSRASGDLQLKAQKRAEFLGQINEKQARLGQMTREQLLSPETAKQFGAREIQDALQLEQNQRIASDQMRIAYEDASITNAASTMTPEQIKSSAMSNQAKTTALQRQQHAGTLAAEDSLKAQKTLADAEKFMVDTSVSRMSTLQARAWLDEVSQAGGSKKETLPDGTQFTVTLDQLKPLVEIREKADSETAAMMHGTSYNAGAVNQNLGTAGRALGVGDMTNPAATPSQNIDMYLNAAKGDMSSEANTAFHEAKRRFDAASDPNSPAAKNPVVRLQLEEQANKFVQDGINEAKKARLARTEKSMQPVVEDFMGTGRINSPDLAVHAISVAALNSETVTAPGYYEANRFMRDVVQSKMAGVQGKVTADQLMANMMTGKLKPIDHATAAARAQTTQAQAGLLIMAPIMTEAYAAAAKSMGLDNVATAISTGAIYKDKIDPRDILREIQKAKGPNGIPQYLAALDAASKEVSVARTKPTGKGDVTVAAYNALLFGNAPAEHIARQTMMFAVDATRAVMKEAQDAQQIIDTRGNPALGGM